MKINLEGAKKHLEELGYFVHYIAVYGSQNYGLDIQDDEYKSDIDYKAIILPSLRDLIHNSQPVSTVMQFEGGQIDVKDIRSYVESAVKCNINFLEILDTELYIGDDRMRPFMCRLMNEQGQIFLKACFGMIMEKEKAMEHPYPSTASKIDKYGYDPKQLHHIARILIKMREFVSGELISFKHNSEERDSLISIKKGVYSLDQARELCSKYVREAKMIRETYDKPMIFEAKEEFIDLSRKIIEEFLRTHLEIAVIGEGRTLSERVDDSFRIRSLISHRDELYRNNRQNSYYRGY